MTILVMSSKKPNARLVGALIITGYLTYGIPSSVLIQPLLQAKDPLVVIAAQPTSLIVGGVLMAMNSAAVVGIGLLLYPVLKRHDETVALAYVVTRTVESLAMLGGIVGLLYSPLRDPFLTTTILGWMVVPGIGLYYTGKRVSTGQRAYTAGAALSVIGTVVAEFLTLRAGLGYRVFAAADALGTAFMFAALFVLVGLGLLFYFAAVGLERALLRGRSARPSR
jgi:hypothetical protein